MTKPEYLQILKLHLSSLPTADVDEILRDQDEHFRHAMSAGRSEASVIQSLGDPKVFANNLLAESKIEKAASTPHLRDKVNSTVGAVIAALALAPLNLIFVFGPFVFLSAIIFSGWAAALGVLVATLALFAAFFVKLIFINVGFFTHLTSFFLCAGWVGLGVLGFLFMYHVTKFFLNATIAYLQWNINFIKSRA